jgi:hypothetical protein
MSNIERSTPNVQGKTNNKQRPRNGNGNGQSHKVRRRVGDG